MPIVKTQQMNKGTFFLTVPIKYARHLNLKKGMSVICEREKGRLIYHPI